jgi:hypothetical protein
MSASALSHRLRTAATRLRGIGVRIEPLKRPINLVDVVRETLGLIEQLLRSGKRLLDGLLGGIREARKIPRLIEQHLGLVLQARDLVSDLFEGAGRLQDILGVVRGVVDDHLGQARRTGKAERDDRDSAQSQRSKHVTLGHRLTSILAVSAFSGPLGSAARRSAAQSSPLRRSQAEANPAGPCSFRISAMAA